MNKYLIPICNASLLSDCWIEVITARSFKDCQEKLMSILIDRFDFLSECDTYSEFVAKADSSNIIIGKIKDIDEI